MFTKENRKEYKEIMLNLPGTKLKELKGSLNEEELKAFNYLNSITLNKTFIAWIESL